MTEEAGAGWGLGPGLLAGRLMSQGLCRPLGKVAHPRAALGRPRPSCWGRW